MKSLQNCALIWIFAVLMAGCASMAMPETNIERLASLEVSYQTVLDKAILYKTEGRLSTEQVAKLDSAFDQYESARDLAQIAIDAGDNGGFDSQSAVIVTALSALRTIVAEAE